MQIKHVNFMNQLKIGNGKISGIENTEQKGKTNGIHLNSQTQTPAATVDFSKSGRYKARMLKESEQSKKDDTMSQAESTIDSIIDTVRNGGKLSKDEERIFNDGLKDLASKQHSDMKDMKLSQDDVLQELKANFLQRQQMFENLKKQVENEQAEKTDVTDNVKLMTNQQENEDKKKLIEILKKSLEEDQDDSDETDDKNVKDDSGRENFTIHGEQMDESADQDGVQDDGAIDIKKKAADVIDKNADQIADMKSQSASEGAKERRYAKNLEKDYEQIMDVLNKDEVSADEKLAAYEKYKASSYDNAYNREVNRIKKNFDLETWLVGKIQFHSHNDIHEVVRQGMDFGQIGTEFIKKFLI